MPAESDYAVGFRLLSLAPGNPSIGAPRIQGLCVVFDLFDDVTLTPQLLIDGAALTSLRTPVVSALAVANLTVPDARTLTIFGAGLQALAQHSLSPRSARSQPSESCLDGQARPWSFSWCPTWMPRSEPHAPISSSCA